MKNIFLETKNLNNYFYNGKKYDICGIVHALVDILAYVDDKFLSTHNLIKGTMTLIDEERAKYLYDNMNYIKLASGGSASNTVAGSASFGARSAIIARVKDDELGAIFKRDIGIAGVDYKGTTTITGPQTGCCFVAVSREDAERTFSTYLGAAVDILASDMDLETIKDSTILYCEGYLLDHQGSKEALLKAMNITHQHNHIVSMSLSDKRCVEEHREDFMKLLENIDLLFANESEIKTLFNTNNLDKAIEEISKKCIISTITLGKKGSMVINSQEKKLIEAVADPKRIVDTTGAGDLYASGFLYGVIKGFDLEKCAKLGNLAAAEIISHLGAKPAISMSSLLELL